jgi:GTP-binding protein Era
MAPDDPAAPAFRAGFIAVVARPNAGKSTLVNGVVERKVSIVSAKPQTTRHRITGVLTQPSFQLVLVDVPGFQRPLDGLTERMQATVETTLEDVDGALFLVAGDEDVGPGDAFIVRALAERSIPTVAALNKVDLLTKNRVAEQLVALAELGDFIAIHPVSALVGDGLGALVNDLVDLLPAGPMFYPDGVVTDRPEEFLVAELVREKVLACTEHEVPHSVAVQVLEFEPREEKRLTYIRAAIYVERESQRPIILGERGRRLKTIGTEARTEIEHLLGTKVFLDLVVRVRKRWRQDPSMLGRLGV